MLGMGGCVGKICKLVQKAVKGDPMPLFENIKATVNGGLDSYAWKIKKKKVKYEFDYHARGSIDGTEFAGFAEWWIFEKLKHCCARNQSDKLMYKNQGKYTTMSSGLAQWDFEKANRKRKEDGKPIPFSFFNDRWDHVKNPVEEKWGVLEKAAAQGGRKSRRKRRKSRRKKSRRKKRGRKRRRTKKKRRRRR